MRPSAFSGLHYAPYAPAMRNATGESPSSASGIPATAPRAAGPVRPGSGARSRNVRSSRVNLWPSHINNEPVVCPRGQEFFIRQGKHRQFSSVKTTPPVHRPAAGYNGAQGARQGAGRGSPAVRAEKATRARVGAPWAGSESGSRRVSGACCGETGIPLGGAVSVRLLSDGAAGFGRRLAHAEIF
jgi:hypothetical protein